MELTQHQFSINLNRCKTGENTCAVCWEYSCFKTPTFLPHWAPLRAPPSRGTGVGGSSTQVLPSLKLCRSAWGEAVTCQAMESSRTTASLVMVSTGSVSSARTGTRSPQHLTRPEGRRGGMWAGKAISA